METGCGWSGEKLRDLFSFEEFRNRRKVWLNPEKKRNDKPMKKISSLIALVGLLAIPAFAADKEVTITGKGTCAKCALHQTDKCQTVIQTEENGKTVTYYLAQNDKSKDFHENVCKKPETITATGTVKEEDGKKVLTASKIEESK